jgi:hypothetical protein
VWARERLARALADRVDRTGGKPDPEQLARESAIPRREIRSRTVNATTAARRLGPNADAPIPSGNAAAVLARHSGQRSRCQRCSTTITPIGGNSATWRRPNRRPGCRSSSVNSWPHPRHAPG